MGKRRMVFFDLDDQEESIGFGTYALIMYYAKTINETEAKKFFDATLTEYEYRVNYDMSTDGLTPHNDKAHFNEDEIHDVITFIENKLVPALHNEPQDLMEKYVSREHFYGLFYDNRGFLDILGINNDEFYYGSPDQLIFIINKLKVFLQYSLSVNKPCQIDVH